jgi:hypothetical protein
MPNVASTLLSAVAIFALSGLVVAEIWTGGGATAQARSATCGPAHADTLAQRRGAHLLGADPQP